MLNSFARVMLRVHLLVTSYTFMSENHGTHSYEGVMVCMYLYLYVRVMSRVHFLVSSYTFMSENYGTHMRESSYVNMYLHLYEGDKTSYTCLPDMNTNACV